MNINLSFDRFLIFQINSSTVNQSENNTINENHANTVNNELESLTTSQPIRTEHNEINDSSNDVRSQENHDNEQQIVQD